MCPAWREIYSWSLKAAGDLYATRDFIHLEPLLEVMEGQIYDEEARRELQDRNATLNVSEQQQLLTIDKWLKDESNPKRRDRILEAVGEITRWRCSELFKFHQSLARKYSLIPGGA